jgi:hypothetical protein
MLFECGIDLLIESLPEGGNRDGFRNEVLYLKLDDG